MAKKQEENELENTLMSDEDMRDPMDNTNPFETETPDAPMAEEDSGAMPMAEETEQPEGQEAVEPEVVQDKNILDEIEDAELSAYILRKLQEDINHRENNGWTTMQKYCEAAYAGYRRDISNPWVNASNYAVTLTKTLINSAHANTISSMYDNNQKLVDATGIGKEDIKNEQHVESILNFEVFCDIQDAFNVLDTTVLRAFKNGNGVVKCFAGFGKDSGKVIWVTVPIQNIFLPINAVNAQPSSADHVFELIPLTENEYEQRKIAKDPTGELAYKNLDDLNKGNAVQLGAALSDIIDKRDAITKTSLGDFYSDSVRYFLECYLTYPHKDKDGNVTLVELVVTLSPNGGTIHRKKLNEDIDDRTGEAVRPYSIRWIPYQNEDRIYGQPLPWIVKKEQEEIDYFHNMMANALERAIKPITFYDPNGAFDPEEAQQAPNGWIPVPNPRNNIFVSQIDAAPIFNMARMIDMFWENAERATGLTELFQGMQPQRGATLGEVNRRMAKAEIRFDTIYKRLEQGFQELMYLTWHYTKKYMPREKAVRILGTGEFKKIEEIFPEGITGNYDFKLTSSPVTERMKEQQNATEAFSMAMSMPFIQNNEANQWRLLDFIWKSKGIRDLGRYVDKPQSVEILSPDEAIRRVMGGEYNYIPNPKIDADNYMNEIKIFMRTDTFANADDKEKQAIQRLLQISEFYRQGQIQAAMDAKVIQEGLRMEAMIGEQQLQGVPPPPTQPIPPQGTPNV